MSAEERLAAKLSELKTLLPPVPEPKGVYRPLVIVDKLVYTSGHLPVRPSGELAYHVLDVMCAFDEASKAGAHVQIQSTTDKPAPLPMGLMPGTLDG